MDNRLQSRPDSNKVTYFRPQINRAGFTLIELIIVLVIIGIASGVVGIMVGRGTDSLEMKTITKEISSVLRYARNHAVSEKRTYCFVIDRDEGLIRLYGDEEKSEEGNEGEEKEVLPVITRNIPEDVFLSIDDDDSDVQHMEFLPLGNSSGGTIKLQKEDGAAYFINVSRMTGRVDIVKEDE